MPKLHLKRTPEEEALHELRKKERREAKRRRRHRDSYHDLEPGSSHSRKRPRASKLDQEPERKWASSDEDEEQYGPQPTGSTNSYPSRGHRPDQDQLRAEMDDDLRFREKLFDACADDERLDSLEARMNDFAHVPDRWRTARRPSNVFESDEWLKTDPDVMDEEEYTEWIRMGMYRKTHAKEYAEEQRQKAAQAARRAEEKARREETARLEKAAEEERKRKKGERNKRQWADARDAYQKQWQGLLSTTNGAEMMEFCDIPWPIFRLAKHRSAVSVDDLTAEAISAFLLPRDAGEGEKGRKEVLREAFLRFHPDKFEGRIMKLVRENEREVVRQGIGRVVVALNGLMAE